MFNRRVGTFLVLITVLASTLMAKPRYWVNTDWGRGEKDDWNCIGFLFLLANEIEIEGIVLAAQNKSSGDPTEDKAVEFAEVYQADYEAELGNLNDVCGGFPAWNEFNIWHSSVTHEIDALSKGTHPSYFKPNGNYTRSQYETVKHLIEAIEAGPITVVNWGRPVEIAFACKIMIDEGKKDILRNNMTLVSNMTMGNSVKNCYESEAACTYLDNLAQAGDIIYYETGNESNDIYRPRGCSSAGNITPDQDAIFSGRMGSHFGHKTKSCPGFPCWDPSEHGPDVSDLSTVFLSPPFELVGGWSNMNADGTKPERNAIDWCTAQATLFPYMRDMALVARGTKSTCPDRISSAVQTRKDLVPNKTVLKENSNAASQRLFAPNGSLIKQGSRDHKELTIGISEHGKVRLLER